MTNYNSSAQTFNDTDPLWNKVYPVVGGFIANVSGVNLDRSDYLDLKLHDQLGLDSLDMFDLNFYIEENLGIIMPDDCFVKSITVYDLISVTISELKIRNL